MTLFIVFSSFGWARDIWETIDYVAAFGEFPSRLLSPWVTGGRINDHYQGTVA